jgi:hypothetical protein
MVLSSIRAALGGQRSGAGGEPEKGNRPVYHRFGPREEAEQVERTGELWGAPPRNIFQSSIPCVKAYAGPLTGSGDGYEFVTDVEPTPSSPWERRWVAGSPGVIVDGDYAKIPVTVTRIRTGKP